MAQAITSQPPMANRPVAKAAAPPRLQRSEAAVSWLGVTPSLSAAFSIGSKHQ